MSALLCGCDTESLWICEEHRPNTDTTSDLVALLQMQQFKDRLAQEEQMKDTTKARDYDGERISQMAPSLAEQFRVEAVRIAKQTPMPPNFKALAEGTWPSDPSPAEQFRAAAVFTASAVLTRDDLLNRIATLEADLGHERDRAVAWRTEALRFRYQWAPDTLTVTRIAVILTRFYTEPLSLSSVQPLIALALELNPDLVERAR